MDEEKTGKGESETKKCQPVVTECAAALAGAVHFLPVTQGNYFQLTIGKS
jgi:hypothetical protein